MTMERSHASWTETQPRLEEEFALEPLVIAERVGYHPDWLVAEGIIVEPALEGPIFVPRVVAQQLEYADSVLERNSRTWHEKLGSVRAPLGLHLMAGHRSPEMQQMIVEQLGDIRQRFEHHRWYNLSQGRPAHWFNASQAGYDCNMRPNAHTSGREVDITVVYRDNGELVDSRYCYDSYFFRKRAERPRSFPVGPDLERVQRPFLDMLVGNAMQSAGFMRSARNRWHFIYTGDGWMPPSELDHIYRFVEK